MKIWRPAILYGTLTTLVIGATLNHFNFSIKPLYMAKAQTAAMLSKNEMGRLSIMSPDLYAVSQAIKAFPPETYFYFVPCFPDSGNSGHWWWYINILTRYHAYPRKILSHDLVLFKDKSEFISKFINHAQTWKDLDWITSRNIKYIILIRNNQVFFIPVTAKIQGL